MERVGGEEGWMEGWMEGKGKGGAGRAARTTREGLRVLKERQ